MGEMSVREWERENEWGKKSESMSKDKYKEEKRDEEREDGGVKRNMIERMRRDIIGGERDKG